MPDFISGVIGNVIASACLAILIAILGRWSVLSDRPAILQWLWFCVLLRLIIPSFVIVPVLPDTSMKLRLEADFRQLPPRNLFVSVVSNETVSAGPIEAAKQVSKPPRQPWSQNWIVGISLLGSLLLGAACLTRSLQLYRLVRHSSPAHRSLTEQAAELAGEFHLHLKPDVRIVGNLATPGLFVGWQNAVILLPQHLLDSLDDEQWFYILAHEVAHLARRDQIFNFVAHGTVYLFWWNPLAWWAWRELRACQEICSDAMVLQRAPASRRRYAETLLQVADARRQAFPLQPQLTLTSGNESVLIRRIRMIANSSVEPRFTTLASVSIAALIISFFCAPVCAEKEKSGGSFGVAPRAIVAQAPTESSRSAAISTLKYDDDRPEGKRSIAGTGLMIHFVKPAAQYQLKSLRIHCARYGMPVAPDEDVKFSIVSDDGATVLHTELIPYSKFKRGEPEWTTIGFKNAVDIPEQFWVVAEFNAERTKGVYVSYDTSTGGKHSKTGLPGQESRNVTTGGDWMIQAILLASKP